MSNNLILALDIGSSKIKMMVAKKENDGWSLISKISRDSVGVKKGNVLESEKLSQRLKEIFTDLKNEIDLNLDGVFLAFAGPSLVSLSSRAAVSISRVDGVVSQNDVERVLKEAQAIKLPPNKEIFGILEQEFIIDGQAGIKNPLGLKGIRLEANILLGGVFSPSLEALKEAVLNSDVEILDIIPSPISLAEACLTDQQKELGVCLLDFGDQTTTLIFVQDGKISDFFVFPFGSSEITKELAIFLKTDYEIAEKIKIDYGNCFFKGKDKRERIEIEGQVIGISLKKLSNIVQRVMSEIVLEISKKTKEILKDKRIPAGFVLSGGGAKLQNIVEFFKNKLKLPCKLANFQVSFIDENDLSFSQVIGLISFVTKRRSFKEGILTKLKKKLRNIFS